MRMKNECEVVIRKELDKKRKCKGRWTTKSRENNNKRRLKNECGGDLRESYSGEKEGAEEL